MTPAQKQVYDLRELGKDWREISETTGKAYNTVRELYHRAVRDETLDPGLLEAMAEIGTDMVPDRLWIKTKRHSMLLVPKVQQEDDFIEKVRMAFMNIPAIPQIKKPKVVLDSLMTVYPLFDVHYGLKAHAAITGSDYNYKIASDSLIEGIGACMALSPNSKRGIIVNGGDFTHADDDTNATPQSKHVLDVDGRNYTTLDGAVDVLSALIELALTKHEQVEYFSVPGNHDPKNWVTIMFALAERFRNNPRVTIEKSPIEFSVITHGKTLIALHHGHAKRKLEDMILWFATTFPIEWSQAVYRTLWTGHNHHLLVKEFPGMIAEQHTPVTKPDHYAASHAFSSFPAIKGITFNHSGEIIRVRDPR